MKRLKHNFYQNDAVAAAEKLVGKLIVREINDKKIIVRIVETEAYAGPDDKASHAYNNRKTERTEVMFKNGGHVYVFLIYGIHHCLNIVTGKRGIPSAVLIRAVEPVLGIDLIRENRGVKSNKEEDLTNGPGKLAQALKIDLSFNGYNLITGSKLYILDNESNNLKIKSSERINIDYAEEYKNKKWRFYLADSKFLSK
ncbi:MULTISPECIES: DNA-3-methyladenine glycosylase [unclassified Halanaerobium]|uniref:DNA-3-methyladenine glycosylase n=1 Tax=unclassified Halanaerobium TaxID=2641197 RepID=UPI000DF12109|nr:MULTISPECIES: DNA-3-methyladenine glycosylase [unclassified Halanaerobium]